MHGHEARGRRGDCSAHAMAGQDSTRDSPGLPCSPRTHAGVARLLVCVDDDDRDALAFWQAARLPPPVHPTWSRAAQALPCGRISLDRAPASDRPASDSSRGGKRESGCANPTAAADADGALHSGWPSASSAAETAAAAGGLWQSARALREEELLALGRTWPHFSEGMVAGSAILCYTLLEQQPPL